MLKRKPSLKDKIYGDATKTLKKEIEADKKLDKALEKVVKIKK